MSSPQPPRSSGRRCEACDASLDGRRANVRFCDGLCAKRKPCRGCGSRSKRRPGGHYCYSCRKPSIKDQSKVLVVKKCCGKTVETTRGAYLAVTASECQGCANRRRASPVDLTTLEQPCIRCGLVLANEFFATTSTGRIGGVCWGCKSQYQHHRRLRLTYGIEPGDYDRMLAEQGGRCAICLRKPGKKRLAVDHDHKCCSGPTSCGECVRGLLCTRCNSGVLGHLHDNIEALERAITYLKASQR